jgi:hypothetical protein
MLDLLYGLLLPLLSSAASVANPLDALTANETFLRGTKNFVHQYNRVNGFSCEKHIRSIDQSYLTQRRHFIEAENILDDEKRREITFFNLQPKDRQFFAPLFPSTFNKFIAQMNRPEIAGTQLPLLLALFFRETNFKIFLDEDATSKVVTGPGARPGAGLAQITAWIEEYKSKWGPHGYEQYAAERLKLEIEQLSKDIPSPTQNFLRQWLPLTIELEGSRKQTLASKELFLKSPYNPVVAFWYGNFSLRDGEAKLKKLGLYDGSPSDKAALFGTFYNAGESRLRCAAERMHIWNDFFSSLDIKFKEESFWLDPKKWESSRAMLYLHSPSLVESGLPADLIQKLENVCAGKKDCSCLDREKASSASALLGADYKGAISTSYGDHMKMLFSCFSEFAQSRSFEINPETAECF